MKNCPRCKEEKELSEFGLNKRNPDGLATYCKPCKSSYQRKHYVENPDKWTSYSKKWREANKERKALADKEYALKHPERVRAAKKKYKQVHKDRVKEQTKNYLRKNKKVLSEKNKIWRETNKEKHNAKEARRRARKAGNGIFVILPKELVKLYNKPCIYCGSKAEHLDHIIPISRGGRHSIGNLASACASCNLSKNNKFIVEWKDKATW